jgi:hypothetical protein
LSTSKSRRIIVRRLLRRVSLELPLVQFVETMDKSTIGKLNVVDGSLLTGGAVRLYNAASFEWSGISKTARPTGERRSAQKPILRRQNRPFIWK